MIYYTGESMSVVSCLVGVVQNLLSEFAKKCFIHCVRLSLCVHVTQAEKIKQLQMNSTRHKLQLFTSKAPPKMLLTVSFDKA